MHVRCQRAYRAGFKIMGGWTSDDFVTGVLETTTGARNKRNAEIRVAKGAPSVLWSLYNVQVGSICDGKFFLSGLEPIDTNRGTRWVYQFWRCEVTRP